MINGINPIADPIGFMVLYYISGMMTEGYIILFKLALISSLLVFPFALLGRELFRNSDKWKTHRLVKIFISSSIMSVVFWLVLGAWKWLWTKTFLSGNFVNAFVLSAAVAFPFAAIGDFMNRWIKENWKIPSVLSVYIICLALSIVFWLLVWGYLLLTLGM